jgi:predicted DNA-binding protein with PD1-like motif
MRSLSTEKVRHLLVRADAGEMLPEALATELRDQAVTAGWLRGSGVLADVELRAYGSESGALGPARQLRGPVQVIALEGSIGLHAGDVSFGLRAVLARETDRGMETLAGEIVRARIVGLEILVAAFDEHAIPRVVDAGARVWLLGEGATQPARAAPAPQRAPEPTPQPPPAWNEAVAASPPADRAKPAAMPLQAALPPRPVRPPPKEDEDSASSVSPEAGDVVEHFAFGKCDVLKSDGDRLYLRMHKDGRIKEIALEMLKVTPIGEEEGKRAYKLARRI